MIASLPSDQGEAVILRVVAGLDVSRVATIMGRSPGSVRVLCHRGLRRLEGMLEELDAKPEQVAERPVRAMPLGRRDQHCGESIWGASSECANVSSTSLSASELVAPDNVVALRADTSSGKLADLIRSASAPAQPHELSWEFGARTAFKNGSLAWSPARPRLHRSPAVIAVAAVSSSPGHEHRFGSRHRCSPHPQLGLSIMFSGTSTSRSSLLGPSPTRLSRPRPLSAAT